LTSALFIDPSAAGVALSITNVELAITPKQPRLTQKSAAIALGLAMIALPTIPQVLDLVLPQPEWAASGVGEDDDSVVELYTMGGAAIEVAVPDDWIPDNSGDSATLYGPGQMIMVQVYDREGRDVDTVTQRLMRLNRISGITTALDGGHVGAVDGNLAGLSCVAIVENMSGPCAYLANDDMLVSIMALSDPEEAEEPVPSIAEVAQLILAVSE
jgi:hypothetical protein